MESFITEDGSVAKFIHDDGSETAVKVVKSCSNFRDDAGHIHTDWVDRGKYSVFISSSLGCYMQCKFCHLTIKDSAYRKLTTERVVANVKEALVHELERRPWMRERFVKLCWMGMGDAVNQPDMVLDGTLELMDWLMSNRLAAGLDCVDLSTVLPKVDDRWIDLFPRLDRDLARFPVNPKSFLVEQAELAGMTHYTARSRFRLFYSVHSAIQETREKMVPRAMPLADAIPRLKAFAGQGPNLLLHQLFVEGLNDSEEEVEALIDLLATHFPSNELRVLRYNFCDRSPYREWDRIDTAVTRLADAHQALKVQVSAGQEVAAACGQFLVAMPRAVARKGELLDVKPTGDGPAYAPLAILKANVQPRAPGVTVSTLAERNDVIER